MKLYHDGITAPVTDLGGGMVEVPDGSPLPLRGVHGPFPRVAYTSQAEALWADWIATIHSDPLPDDHPARTCRWGVIVAVG